MQQLFADSVCQLQILAHTHKCVGCVAGGNVAVAKPIASSPAPPVDRNQVKVSQQANSQAVDSQQPTNDDDGSQTTQLARLGSAVEANIGEHGKSRKKYEKT
ncbi:unnamed protein product [Ceratitis capitata]|uniref:(Mediterranean fruit fly) hypothetical protein n=1 Tax=Ceratitis capitata TaxID=7213 RepID=A0A811VIV0_CERCA|nr:unnamed protein product [Ceratitis capitata]